MIRKAWFVIRLAAQDLRGNAGIHLVAGGIITAAFITLGLFLLLSTNLSALSRHWEEKIQICVYLTDQLADEDRKAMFQRLESLPEVKAVDYVSKDQALDEFREMLGDDADLLEGLDHNPLPASFILSLEPMARGVDQVKALAKNVSAWPGVGEVDYGGRLLEGFASASGIIQGAALMLGGLILVAVVFIISNTIRLTMYSRSEEIGIMRLVGASNLLIRLPFVIEGMVQGFAAAIMGAALLWAFYLAALKGAAWPGIFGGFAPVFLSGSALWALLLGGAALGAAGSVSRVRDFLKV